MILAAIRLPEMPNQAAGPLPSEKRTSLDGSEDIHTEMGARVGPNLATTVSFVPKEIDSGLLNRVSTGCKIPPVNSHTNPSTYAWDVKANGWY